MTDAGQPRGWRLAAGLVLLAASLAGCTVVTGRPGFSYRNEPDTGRSFVRPLTPVPRASTEWVADKPQFIGLAMSGGGSRSANFGTKTTLESISC